MNVYYGKVLDDVVVSATPPVDPYPDQLWWDSSNDSLKVWKGSVWVPQGSTAEVKWDDITGKPTSFPPETPIPQNDVAGLVPALAGKAPLVSPVLTGTPIVPTAAPGNNSNQIASTAFVGAAVATAVGGIDVDVSWDDVSGKPSTFPPTVHAHAQSDITNLITDLTSKANVSGQTFTGTITVPASTASAAGFILPPGNSPPAVAGIMYMIGNSLRYRGTSITSSVATLGQAETFTAAKTFATPAAALESIIIPHGAAPTTPTNGSIWTTNTSFNIQLNGATKNVAFLEGATFTGRINAPQSTVLAAGFNLGFGGVVPTTPVQGDIWFSSNSLRYQGGATYTLATVNSNQTFSGTCTYSTKPIMTTPSASTASINLPHGSVGPSAPVNGDLWSTSAGLYVQINGATVGPIGATAVADWNTLLNKPATFPPTTPIAQASITNLVTDLSGKAPTVHTHAQADVTNLVSDLSGKAPTVHSHTTADVTGLDTALTGKAATVHTHAQADVTNLTTDLGLKAPIANPTFTGQVIVPQGTIADPGLRVGDAGFGLYQTGTGISISAAGAQRMALSTAITNLVQARFQYGTASAPGIAFQSATSSGIYGAANTVGISIVTAVKFTVTDTAVTTTVKLTPVTSAAANAGFNLTHGAAPTTPVDGDLWSTSAGGFYGRVNGVTKNLSIHVGTTAPVSPITNDLWLDIN